MKRSDLPALLLFLLASLFPGICLISKLLGYTLLLHSGKLFAVLSTVLYGWLGGHLMILDHHLPRAVSEKDTSDVEDEILILAKRALINNHSGSSFSS